MRRITSAQFRNFRNIRHADLKCDSPVVVFRGGNGAGKTSLLEALYLVARGRSFRGGRHGSVTTEGAKSTRVELKVLAPDGSANVLGYQREHGGVLRWFDGVPDLTKAQWRERFSLKLVGENCQILLQGDPGLRRALLDWNLSHVEPDFQAQVEKLRRIVVQRNAWLRSRGRSGPRVWDTPFVEQAERVHEGRVRYIEQWRSRFLSLCHSFPFLREADIKLSPGWPSDCSLREALAASRVTEETRGYTVVGPGRADFQVIDGGKRREIWSRGQQKVIVILLQLAADSVQIQNGFRPAIWLLDDLASDLDSPTLERVWDLYLATNSQIFVTRIAERLSRLPADSSQLVFHVEQGNVSAVI